MAVLKNKIDFALVISVDHANPNGDPLDGNRPRTTFDGYGEISDVCLKRKIRNRLQDEGYSILIKSDDRIDDGCPFIKNRVETSDKLKFMNDLKKKNKESGWDEEEYRRIACSTWLDVRTFGQVFAFKAPSDKADSTSVGVRGPMSIQPAYSVEPVPITSLQITKSTSSEKGNDDSDTMGTKHRVDKGIYVTKGSINVQLAEKTGFTDEDADAVREALRTLFRNDVSSARPDGSMEVLKLIWWKHNCKTGQYSSAKVHHTLHVAPDGSIELEKLPDLEPDVVDGE